MNVPLPYCGTPPAPGELLTRFNLDPILIAALVALAFLHVYVSRTRRTRLLASAGWCIAAAALISPLCALSVALFSARIGQHMILVLIAAPLIASAWPISPSRRAVEFGCTHRRSRSSSSCGCGTCLSRMTRPSPRPGSTGRCTSAFSAAPRSCGASCCITRRIGRRRCWWWALRRPCRWGSSERCSLLPHIPLFFAHLTTTAAWGLTPLQDQQFGGTLMWVPGIALFLYVALRSIQRLWRDLETPRPV